MPILLPLMALVWVMLVGLMFTVSPVLGVLFLLFALLMGFFVALAYQGEKNG